MIKVLVTYLGNVNQHPNIAHKCLLSGGNLIREDKYIPLKELNQFLLECTYPISVDISTLHPTLAKRVKTQARKIMYTKAKVNTAFNRTVEAKLYKHNQFIY